MVHGHGFAGHGQRPHLRLQRLVGHGGAGALVKVVGPAGDDEALDIARGVAQIAVDPPQRGAVALARCLQQRQRGEEFLGLLGLDGVLVEVGAPEQPMPVAAFSLIGNRRSLAGSLIGGIAQTQEMLDFCAEHGLGSEIEVISADQIDEAYERVVASDVRYRFVIDTATIA